MSRDRPLTADARRLIAEQVRSVGTLDLLLLVRAESDRWWTAAEISATLDCPGRWAVLRLEDLHAGGLLAADGDGDRRYTFRPRSPGLGRAVEVLAEAYEARAGEVVKLIFAAPRTRGDRADAR
jgi:DNA-binding IclR family transcriptional regulator